MCFIAERSFDKYNVSLEKWKKNVLYSSVKLGQMPMKNWKWITIEKLKKNVTWLEATYPKDYMVIYSYQVTIGGNFSRILKSQNAIASDISINL